MDIWRNFSFPLGRVWVGILFTLGLCACSSTQQLPPIDDAYYWAEKTTNPSPVTDNPSPVTDNPSPVTVTPSKPSGPAIEYSNIQDTTVTIRIKK